ncbi:HIT domain-containing protein [Patescibacteria group bacterium]|nr:HIT domain-containing protein [Patescibacteria group bacterium]
MKDCIFCKIINEEIPCHKIYEDNNYLAFLDIHPNTKGMTLVVPKKHYHSDAFDMPKEAYIDLMLISKKIAKVLEKKLSVKRVAMVMEGMGIDHIHIKLYPLHGLKNKFVETWADKKIFFKEYEGYITTLMGERANDKELAQLAKKIRE